LKSEGSTETYEKLTNKYLNGDIEIEHLHAYIRSYGTTLQDRGFSASSPNNVVLGTVILWVGWMFFNGGSSLGLTDPNDGWTKASLAMVNTIVAPSTAGLTSFFCRKYITGENHEYRLDFDAIANGILAGAVSITAGCADVEPWCAFIIGIIGAFVYSSAVVLLKKLEIDDPVEATQVHGFCGIWGCIAIGLFHSEKGLFFGGGGKLLGANALGCLVIAVWTSGISSIYFLTVRHFGHLRLSKSDELLGGDIHYFAPIKFEGKVSTYTKGLALTRLNTTF
jgi:ammonium transporter, Amt family